MTIEIEKVRAAKARIEKLLLELSSLDTYSRVFYMDDGEAICHECAISNAESIISSLWSDTKDGWFFIGVEGEQNLEHYEKCAGCDKNIDGYHDALQYELFNCDCDDNCINNYAHELCPKHEHQYEVIKKEWEISPTDSDEYESYICGCEYTSEEDAIFIKDRLQSIAGSTIERDERYLYCIITDLEEAKKELSEAHIPYSET